MEVVAEPEEFEEELAFGVLFHNSVCRQRTRKIYPSCGLSITESPRDSDPLLDSVPHGMLEDGHQDMYGTIPSDIGWRASLVQI